MKEAPVKLVFVYNADSGLFNTVTDIAHKIFSPKTYNCKLCALSHGYFTEHKEWRTFIESLEIPMEFLHRDEFLQKYGEHKAELPAVFRSQGDSLMLCISRDELEACDDINELKKRVLKALGEDLNYDRNR
jgi:hypothetical protein